jgi:hypothetical protein
MKNLMICIIMAIAVPVIAQKYTVKGSLKDKDNLELIGAVVVLLNPSDSVMVAYGVTNTKGEFSMPNIKAGIYNMQITYVGYGTIQRSLELSGDDRIKDLGVIVMGPESQMISEVTITAEYIPIKITKDTMEFNADAFKTQPNAVVEELLKRLPGVEVDAEGNIKVQGEDVKAVTVDGKDFFGKDPKMATKNLPADAVKKVQIFDRKSKTSEFTGIDDGNDEKTINLELKENRKGGSFGNISAGYGTNDRYESKLMLNKFAKSTQISLIGSLNNLNQTGISASDYMSLTGSSGGFGRNMGGSGAPISWGPNNNGEITSGTIGLNMNYDFGKKSKFNASYYLTKANTDLIQTSNTETFLQEAVIYSEQANLSASNATNHTIFTNLDWKIDSTTELQLINNLTFRANNSNADRNVITLSDIRESLNSSNQIQNSNSEAASYSGEFNLRKRLRKKGRTITLDGRYSNSASEDFTRLVSEIFDRNNNINLMRSVFQVQDGENNANSYNIGLNFTEPLSEQWFMTLNMSRRNNNSELIREFRDLDPETLTNETLNDLLSRAYDNTFSYNVAGANFRFRNQSFNLTFGGDFQQSSLNGKIRNLDEPIEKDFFFFLPKASFQLENANLRFNYSTSIREPSIDQLQPVPDNSDPLNIYLGNPDLVPEYRHNVNVRYNYFDQFNFRGFFANLRVGYTKNRITTASFVDEFFVRNRRPVNTEGETTLGANFNYSSPLNVIGARFRTGINSSWTNGINFIQNLETSIDRLSNGFNFTLENKKKDKFDISVTTRYSFNNTFYKENSALNNSFVNQTYEGNLALYPGKGWTIDTRYELFVYAQAGFTEDTKVNLWQASVSKAFMDNRLTAKLRVFDILNQNQGVTRSAVDNYISETISNTIGRYFMFSLQYNLSALSSPQASGPRMMIMH